jgi:hypothetical protein
MRAVAAAALMPALWACADPDEPPLPSAEEILSYYSVERTIEAEINGNVAELILYQPAAQLQRGGSLWAKVGPYIYLFSDATRQLMRDHAGLAAVRVITRDPSGDEVARATLARGTLNDLTWRRALNLSGRARRDGSQRVGLLEDLIRWGEDRTDFEYSQQYVRR